MKYRYPLMSEYKATGICLNCSGPLPDKKHKKYCSVKCYRDFYDSHYWPALRYKMVRDVDYKCFDCGNKYDGYFKLELHHIKPISRGGALLNKLNLVVLCHDCHVKRHKTLKEAL